MGRVHHLPKAPAGRRQTGTRTTQPGSGGRKQRLRCWEDTKGKPPPPPPHPPLGAEGHREASAGQGMGAPALALARPQISCVPDKSRSPPGQIETMPQPHLPDSLEREWWFPHLPPDRLKPQLPHLGNGKNSTSSRPGRLFKEVTRVAPSNGVGAIESAQVLSATGLHRGKATSRPCRGGCVMPIFQMRQPRLRESKWLCQRDLETTAGSPGPRPCSPSATLTPKRRTGLSEAAARPHGRDFIRTTDCGNRRLASGRQEAGRAGRRLCGGSAGGCCVALF